MTNTNVMNRFDRLGVAAALRIAPDMLRILTGSP